MLAVALLAVVWPAFGDNSTSEPVPLAIVGFDYLDTSGEVNNPQGAHDARLQSLADVIGDEVAHSGKYRIVALDCAHPPCSPSTSDTDQLIGNARKAGARLLLFGGVWKMSTLVQFGRFQVVDLEADKLVFDKKVTFRGDNDEAWKRAGEFLAEEFLAADFPK